MKEDFDQSERWVHSPSSKWDDWQMRRPIIKKRLQIDSKTKSRSVSYGCVSHLVKSEAVGSLIAPWWLAAVQVINPALSM